MFEIFETRTYLDICVIKFRKCTFRGAFNDRARPPTTDASLVQRSRSRNIEFLTGNTYHLMEHVEIYHSGMNPPRLKGKR